MKRIFALILVLLLLLSACAQASLDYNSFFDDDSNAGRFTKFSVAGEYVYWLHAPDDSLDWLEKPANLYRMKPGGQEAELVLQGREDFWMEDVHFIGRQLLISAADENGGQAHPAVMNLDGDFYKVLPGNIGSVVVYPNVIMNSVDGAIYEIDTDDLKPKKVYTYPAAIAADNPILVQREGINLCFVTDSHDWYQLDLGTMRLTKICRIRGDGFVREYKLYISDYDSGGTYRYNVLDGSRQQISENTYMFLQGSGDFVLAKLQDPAGLGSAEGGRIFDLTWLRDDLQGALIGTCDAGSDFLLGGRLYSYDRQANRVDASTQAVAQLIGQ